MISMATAGLSVLCGKQVLEGATASQPVIFFFRGGSRHFLKSDGGFSPCVSVSK
jgi:hypothetical protein